MFERDLCDLQNGSFGLRAYLSPTIFYSLTIEENSNQTSSQSPTDAPTFTPYTSHAYEPTSAPSSDDGDQNIIIVTLIGVVIILCCNLDYYLILYHEKTKNKRNC